MEMEYRRAFVFPQQDPAWVKKWAIAGALSLVPVVGQILIAGYGVAIARRVINGASDSLPEWSDFGDYARQGLSTLVIGLVYFLPLIVVSLCLAVPIAVVSAVSIRDSGGEQVLGLLGGCLGLFALVYSLLAGMALMAALGRYAAGGELGAALNVGEVLRLVRAKPGLYLMVLLVGGLGQFVLSLLGVIACAVGAAWGGAYAQLAQAHLIGQAQRYQREAGAAQ